MFAMLASLNKKDIISDYGNTKADEKLIQDVVIDSTEKRICADDFTLTVKYDDWLKSFLE